MIRPESILVALCVLAAAGGAPASGRAQAPAPEVADSGSAPEPSETASSESDPALESALQELFSAPPPPLPPDAFGYRAIELPVLVADARWEGVREQPFPPLNGEWSGLLERVRGQPVRRMAEAVNDLVNRRIVISTDDDLYGVSDHWASLSETIDAGRGDCEDFAIAKMQLLQAAGAPAADLYMLLVRDLGRNIDHAILLVRDNGELLVLDSAAQRVQTLAEVTRYRPIAGYNGATRWIFRVATADADLTEAALMEGAAEASAAEPRVDVGF